MSKNGLIPGSIKKIQILDLDKKYYYKNGHKKNVIKLNKQKNTNNTTNNDIIIANKNNSAKKNNCRYQNKHSKQTQKSNQNNYVKICKSKASTSSSNIINYNKSNGKENNPTTTNNGQIITRSISNCNKNQSANNIPKVLVNKFIMQEKNNSQKLFSSNSIKKHENEINKNDDYYALNQNEKPKNKKNTIKIIFKRMIPKENNETEKNNYSYLRTSFFNFNKELNNNNNSISENSSFNESSKNEDLNFQNGENAVEKKINNLRNKKKRQNNLQFSSSTNNSIVGSGAYNLKRLDCSPQTKNNSKPKKDKKKGRKKRYTISKNKNNMRNNYLNNYVNCANNINSKIDKRTDSTGPHKKNKINIVTINSNSKQMNNSNIANTLANGQKSKEKDRDKGKFNNTITKKEKNRNINYSCSKINSNNNTKNLTSQKKYKISSGTVLKDKCNINRSKKKEITNKPIIKHQQQKHFYKNNKKSESPIKNNEVTDLYSTKIFSSNNSCEEFSLNQTTTTNNPNFNYTILSNKEETKNFEKNNEKNINKVSNIQNLNIKTKSHFGSQSCKNISSNEVNTSNICSNTNTSSKPNIFDGNKKLKNPPSSKIMNKTKKIKENKENKEIKGKIKIYQSKQSVKFDNQTKNNMNETSNKTRRNSSNRGKYRNNQSKLSLHKEPISAKKFLMKYKKYLKNNEIDEIKNLNKKGELIYYLGEILPRIKNEENTYIKLNQSFDHSNDLFIKNNEINRTKTCINFRKITSEKTKNIKNEFNHYSFNDKGGDFIARKGWHINYRYEILKCLGRGSFGEAIKCYDHKNNDVICIKIINSQERFQNQALVEIKIVSEIANYDINNDSNNVKFYNYFKFRGHICLVFELLSINLYEYIQLNNFIGFDIQIIKNYTIQILFALLFLRCVNIIHCDLKPENILLLPNNENQIKIIDFGSSCFEKEKLYSYIQSRFYRAPEIILEIGYSFEIDMWSLGCILCELYTGQPIFPGMNEKEQIILMIDLLGNPPSSFIENSPKKEYLFGENYKDYCDNDSETDRLSNIKIKKLKKFLNKAPDNFIDFINKCLMWDSYKRLTPEKALFHPFIIENMNESSLYKHKLKVKHIKYCVNNYTWTKNKESPDKKRGKSCCNERMKHKKKLNISLSKIYENPNGFSKDKLYTNNYYEIEKKNIYKYTVTNSNANNDSYASHYSKKKKHNRLSLDTEMNVKRIVTESNNNQNGFYKSFFNKKKNKKTVYHHLPKKQSLGRAKNYTKNIEKS